MRPPTLYLAGPICGQSYGQAMGWRESVKRQLWSIGILCYSPIRGKGYLHICDNWKLKELKRGGA